MNEEELDNSAKSIIEQLKERPKAVSSAPDINLNSDNLEDFVLKYAGNLVVQSAKAVELVQDYITSAPTAEDASALADLINAQSAAIENVNRILIQNKRAQNNIKVKQMDIDGRKENLNTALGAQLLLTREELMEQLFYKSGIKKTGDIVEMQSVEVIEDSNK